MLISFLRSRFSSSGKDRVLRSFTRSRGFTIVELLVVLAIITILTALILFQHRRFDSSTLLRALTYSIALSIRQAQTYGTSVRQFGTGADSFGYSYGVYFTKTPACSTGTSCYFLFADVNKDTDYSDNEKVQAFNLGNGYSINTFCGVGPDFIDCSGACPAAYPTCNSNKINSLSIYFKRPNPDAFFAANGASGNYSSVYIQIVSPAGGTNTRSVTIYSTGQISVNPLLGS